MLARVAAPTELGSDYWAGLLIGASVGAGGLGQGWPKALTSDAVGALNAFTRA
jgi:hypothetical protein